MNRASHSFFAAFTGWLVPFLGYLAYMQFGSGFGYITDFEFILFWPLAFTFLGWLVVGLPVVMFVPADRMRSWPIVVTISVAATTFTFLILAALLRFGLLYFLWWPVLIGLIGGTTYWILQRHTVRPGWIFWLCPIAFFPIVRYVLLPLGITFFPYTTHILGEGAIGDDALIAVIERVKVGDTFEDLHRRYPAIFPEPILGMSRSSNRASYSISFDPQSRYVTSVEIQKHTEQGAAANP